METCNRNEERLSWQRFGRDHASFKWENITKSMAKFKYTIPNNWILDLKNLRLNNNSTQQISCIAVINDVPGPVFQQR